MPRFATRPLSSDTSRRQRRGGFALLITVTLLAFLVLLLVSLASLTRVETQVAANTQTLSQARQNAILALNIALGELQKYAGPDQRTTARADIGTALDGTRQWTGVWGNASNPQSSAKSTPALLQWLVSGNHGTVFNTATAVSSTQTAFGQIITPPPSQTFTPDKPVAGLTAGSPSTTAVTIDSKDAVLLAATATAGSTTATGYVAAPLVDIKVSPAQVPGASSAGNDIRIGRYAYWVGDEGVKARFNTVDPNVTPTAAMTAAGVSADADSLYRLMSPQRFGVERVNGYAQYPANNASLRSVMDENQAGLVVPGLTTQARQAAFHDLTAVSLSVLSDPLHGGLKRDLTYAFARNSLSEYRSVIRDPLRTISAASPNPLLSGALDATATDLNVLEPALIAEQGPTWEQLRSFARLGADINPAGEISPRIQTGENQGVYPVLVQARLGFVGGKTIDGSDPTLQRFIFRLSPVFVLANPYNVTIAAGKYRVRAIFDSSGAGYGVYLGSNVNGTVRTPIWRKTLRELFDGQVYELNCRELAPGQARLFTLAADETWAPQKTYQFDNEWAETMISLDTGAEVTDTDIQTYGLHAVFSDTGTQNSWRPNGTINSAGATDGTITWALTGETDEVYQRFSNFVARGSGASVYDGGFFNSTGAPKDDPEVRGYFMFKLGESGHFQRTGELNQIDIYPYYALGNIRAPMVGRPNWYKDKSIFSSLTFNQVFSKSVNKERYQHWFRFGSSDPTSSAEVEWQGVLKVGSMGNSTPSLPQAQMRWPMADVPREPDGPVSGLVSLGQLQHFNASGYNDGQILPSAADLVALPTTRPSNNESWRARHIGSPNPVGNSRANPFVRRDLVRTQWPNNATREPFHDQCYLLNRALFDGYFFSTYPQNTALPVDLNTRRLANSSLLPFRRDVAVNNTEAFRGNAATFNPDDVLLPARNLVQRGGFNINSTSVAAWRALLGSLGGTNFNGETNLTGPFVRSVRQSAGSAGADTGLSQNAWSGFRNLTSAQIDALATELVAQIKRRGPAVSLADFINRKLVTDIATNAADGLAGPIQAAIDSSGVNAALTTQIKNWENIDAAIAAPTAHTLYPYPAHLPVHPLEGIAGWLSQADIVQAIAPILTARSDTFRIRAYGETRNPATDEMTGRAWCEAIVQRLPDYITPADNDAIATGTALTAGNRAFGRKFIVTGFRWLTPEEI